MKDVTGRGKCCINSFVYLLSFLCKDVSGPWFVGMWRGHRVWIESVESQNYRTAELGKTFKVIQSNLFFEDSSFLETGEMLAFEVFFLLFHCLRETQAAFMDK